MSKVAAAVVQTLWDCRWSRPGYRLRSAAEHEQPESLWVCIRTGGRRPITEDECERCEHWEASDAIDERDERG